MQHYLINPMQTKTAPTQSPQTQQHQAKLKKAHSDIKNAYHAGLFSGGMTLFFTMAAMGSPELAKKTGLSIFALIDVVLIFGLTYGINRGNRMAARFMLGYVVLSKMLQAASGQFNGMFVGLLLIYCFYLGVNGTNALYELQLEDYVQGDSGNSYESDQADEYDEVADSARTTPAPKNVSKFWVSDELVELCQGDRSQAEWLIHQLRVKHPSQDMDWYNERAIEQLNNPKTS
jgi:hypothetical protein